MEYYIIFGRKVGAHVLSMLTLGTVFGGAAFAMRGSKDAKQQGPPVNASSKEEEDFIQEFLKNAEQEDNKETAKH